MLYFAEQVAIRQIGKRAPGLGHKGRAGGTGMKVVVLWLQGSCSVPRITENWTQASPSERNVDETHIQGGN